MKRDGVPTYLAGGLCAVIFLAAAVWLIQWEGERTRRALLDTATEEGRVVANQSTGGAARLAHAPVETMDKVVRDGTEDGQEGVRKTADRAVAVDSKPADSPSIKVSGKGSSSVKTPTAGGQPPKDEKPPATGNLEAPPAGEIQITKPKNVSPTTRTSKKPPSGASTTSPKSTVKAKPTVSKTAPAPHVPTTARKAAPAAVARPNPQPPPAPAQLAGVEPISTRQAYAAPQGPAYVPDESQRPITVYHHASTAEEGYMRGMADLVRANSHANLANSAAMVNHSAARTNEIQNRLRWTQTYFEMRRMNRSYRAQERGTRPGMEDLVRYAQAGKPKRLCHNELDCISGRISWPLLLQAERFADARAALQEAFAERARRGGIGLDGYTKIRRNADQMKAKLNAEARQVPPNQYVIARSFLDSLAYEADLPPS